MIRRLTLLLVLLISVPASAGELLLERLERDPRHRTDVVIAGDALDRLDYLPSAPKFDGDAPGQLRARYDANLPAGLFGFPLPQSWREDDRFAAAFVWEIASDGFAADPNGFFQISFGLWRDATTGLERTGDLESFFVDSFDLIEFDYFPNVSPFFGGPFIAPVLLGSADPTIPGFDGSGATVNGSFFFGPPAELPLDTLLLTLITHDPESGELAFTSWIVPDEGRPERFELADATIAADALPTPSFTVDTIGLTLWQDGFSGETPSLQANVDLHLIAASDLEGSLRALIGQLWPEVIEFLP